MKNKNGFTLIEIIVSIMIASIGMLIATTIILDSMGYFDKTVAADTDKQSLDGIKNYFQEELMFASDVRIQTDYPKKSNGDYDGDWHYLFIKDNKLYRDKDSSTDFNDAISVYNEDYYKNGRKVFIQARGIGDYRIDLKFYITDRNGKISSYKKDNEYKTSSTIELLNLKEYIIQKNGISYLKDVKSLLDLSTDTGYGGYKVFYKKEEMLIDKSEEDDSLDTSGTVADQIACMTDKNNKGEFLTEKRYYPGDMIYLIENGEKVWYRCIHTESIYASTVNEIIADSSLRWKRIDAYYNEHSGYLKGDRVIDKKTNKYYECIKDTMNTGGVKALSLTEFWKEIEKPKEPNKNCKIQAETIYKDTVADKDDDPNIVIEDYDEASGIGGNTKFVRYNGDVWLKLDNGAGNTLPGEKNNQEEYVWQKIQMNWDATSGYNTKDIIFYKGEFYKATQKIRDGREPLHLKWGSLVVNDGWKKVTYNESTGEFNDNNW